MKNPLKKVKKATSTVVGGVAGATLFTVKGGAGLAIFGGAVGLSIGAYVAVGAVLGAAGYGIYRIIK